MSDTTPTPFPPGPGTPDGGAALDPRGDRGVDPDGVPPDGGPGRPARRVRVLLLTAGVLVVVLTAGAAAAVVLLGGGEAETATGDDERPGATRVTGDTAGASPSTAPTGTAGEPGDGPGEVSAAPLLPGDPSVGRNVFAPLVDTGEGTSGAVGGTGAPEVSPTDAALPVPSVAALPSASTVTVAGPTVTELSVVTQTVAGPTTTRTVTESAAYTVAVTSVADPAVDDSAVTFTVNGSSAAVAVGGTFGPGGAFTYVDYSSGTGLVTFAFGSSQVVTPVGRTFAFP